MSAIYESGDWVKVKPEHDIPPMLRPDGKPTTGRIDSVNDDGSLEVWVPIGDASVDEHSQAVVYNPDQVERAEAPDA